MLFIFLLALLIFGPKKLPEIGRQIGKALAEFKRASNEFKYQLENEIDQLDMQERQQKHQQELASKTQTPAPAGTLERVPFEEAQNIINNLLATNSGHRVEGTAGEETPAGPTVAPVPVEPHADALHKEPNA